MSDENTEIEATQEVAEETAETAEIPQVDPAEAKARAKGWVGLEEWTEQGKDPNDWAPYKFFNEKGDMISQIQSLKRQTKEFDSRLAQSNEAWKARLEIEKANLTNQRNEAIEDADVSKVNQLDQQINEIDKQQASLSTPTQLQVDPNDVAAEEAYFATLTTRSKQVFAQTVAAPLINQGLSGQALIDAVDAEMQKEFPKTNPRRSAAPVTDSKPRQSKSNDDYSIDSLTKEDKQILSMMKSYPSFKGKSDSEILKAFKDTKK